MVHWTDEDLKELEKKYPYYLEHKEEAEECFKREWYLIAMKASTLGITSSKINKECASFLGDHVAERVLSYVYKDVQRMPYGNKGYDFICNKGFKIDVKSSCLNLYRNNYTFAIRCNVMADYFLLIGFDNRNDLNPQHIWLIKSDEIMTPFIGVGANRKLSFLNALVIPVLKLSKFSKYELSDKLKDVISCCDELK